MRKKRRVGLGLAVARPTLAAALVVCAGLVLAPPATAHAILVSSAPSDGAVLTGPPATVSLWFSEEVDPALSSAAVLDDAGRNVAGLRLRGDPRETGRLDASLPRLSPGLYSVAWRVFAQDGHYAQGVLVFRIGAGPKPATAGSSGQEIPLPILDGALRWIDLAALAALTGAVAVAGWVLSPCVAGPQSRDPVRRARRRVLRGGVVAAGLALVIGSGLLVQQVGGYSDGSLSGNASAVWPWALILVGTPWGTLWLVRQALLVSVAAILLATYRAERTEADEGPSEWVGSPRTLAMSAAGILIGGLAFVHILAGHAAADDSQSGLTVVAGTVHLLAAAIWVGGLLALIVGLPRSGEHGSDPAVTRTYLRRFGQLALVGVGLVAVTGLYYAGQEVASIDALISTLYGQALLGKIGLFLAAAAFGLGNALLLYPPSAALIARLLRRPVGWMPLRTVRSFVTTEACLGVLVLAGAGVLGATVPADGPEFAPAAEPSPASLTQDVDDLLLTVSVRPNQPGPNVFEVLAASTRRPPLAEVEQVMLRFTNPADGTEVISPPLSRLEPSRYRLNGDYFGTAGAWQLDVLIERSGFDESVARFDWSVNESTPPRPVVVSSARLEPPLTWASAVALLSLAAVGAWLLLRGRLRAVPKQRVDVSGREDVLRQADDFSGLTTLADRIPQEAP